MRARARARVCVDGSAARTDTPNAMPPTSATVRVVVLSSASSEVVLKHCIERHRRTRNG
jgi:hypothetical protein